VVRVCAQLLCLALLAVGCGGSQGSGASATTSATTSAATGATSIGLGLRGAAGLRATVYARGLRNVSALAFDAEGRLWATTSAAANHARDGVYLIPSAGAKPVEVIRGVEGPLGLLWHGGRLYVTSLGRVDVYDGLAGDRFATHRTVLVEPAGHGWNNAIVALASGRLAMGISSACDHCASTSKWSGTIVSFRPDGSDVRVYAAGIRAPFGIAADPLTGALIASMNQRDDLGAKTPGDWLGLVRSGQDWRFPECYGQAGAACAGVPAPLAVLDAHAAAGGVAIAGARLLGGTGRSALVSEWERGVVLRVRLRATASGYASARPAVLVSGLKNPLPLVTAPGGDLIAGAWGSGIVYRIARA
jgi:glucose/arabinose dehydrogenase